MIPQGSRMLCDSRRLKADCEAAQTEARQTEQALASVRGLVRSALVELDERVRVNAEATMTLADIRAQVVFGLSELVAFVGEPLAENLEQGVAFDDSDLANWVQTGLDGARVKMIVSVRGANKTGVLRAVRSWLRTREVAAELNVCGRKISPNSIRTYRTALMAAYLVEVSEVYDTFERSVVRNLGGRVFWTDLELRNFRFGAAIHPDGE